MKYFMTFMSGVILTSGFVVAYRTDHTPNCPTEDACSIDYSHGAWHVREVTP